MIKYLLRNPTLHCVIAFQLRIKQGREIPYPIFALKEESMLYQHKQQHINVLKSHVKPLRDTLAIVQHVSHGQLPLLNNDILLSQESCVDVRFIRYVLYRSSPGDHFIYFHRKQ